MIPCCRIEAISSCNASRPKSLRGCNALGTMLAKLIWCTLSPDSVTSVPVAAEGEPISAPRPLPKPERAISPEANGTALLRQTAIRADRERERTHSMYSLIQLKTLVSCGRDPARPLPLGRGFLLIPLIMVCFAFLPQMRAGLPPEIPGNPDGCYPAFNTAEGCNALFQVTGGIGDTAVGWYSNFLAGDASFNTSVGAGTLALDSGLGAGSNTAVGTAAMILNLSGSDNCAVGVNALVNSFTGSFN